MTDCWGQTSLYTLPGTVGGIGILHNEGLQTGEGISPDFNDK